MGIIDRPFNSMLVSYSGWYPLKNLAGTVFNTMLMTNLHPFMKSNVGNKIHNPHPDFVTDQTYYDY